MATVDIVVPSGRAILEESYQTLVLMAQAAECNCGTHYPWKCDKGLHSVRFVPCKKMSVVHWARNFHTALAMYGMRESERPQAEFIMFVDDDMMCGKDHLTRLLSQNRDIVSGIATFRRDPPEPNIKVWRPDLQQFVKVMHWDFDSKELLEIDAVGAAFLLVKRGVLKQMAKAHLDCRFERQEDLRKYPGREKEVDAYWNIRSAQRLEAFDRTVKEGVNEHNWWGADCRWFQFLDNVVDTQLSEMGEDIGFCWKAKKLGYRIFGDPQVLPGHVGSYAYSVHDHIAFVKDRKPDLPFVPGLSYDPEKPIKRL